VVVEPQPLEQKEMTAPIGAQSPVSAPTPPEPRYIIIAEGQSLSRIARANHLSARVIAAANHLEPPYPLKAGTRLLIPDP
jgi:LysM repeat protein